MLVYKYNKYILIGKIVYFNFRKSWKCTTCSIQELSYSFNIIETLLCICAYFAWSGWYSPPRRKDAECREGEKCGWSRLGCDRPRARLNSRDRSNPCSGPGGRKILINLQNLQGIVDSSYSIDNARVLSQTLDRQMQDMTKPRQTNTRHDKPET